MPQCRSWGACTSKRVRFLRGPASAVFSLVSICVVPLTLVMLLAMTLALPARAGAAQTAHLLASFSPDRAGASTTVRFGFTITGSEGQVPSPLRSVDLHLPAGLGLARNTLGTAICEPEDLYAIGPQGCPANSRVGYGSALAELPYGPMIVDESASVYAYRGENEHEHVTILFFTEALYPVFATLVFPGVLLEDSGPFSNRIDTEVPLIPSVPGGPNVSVVRFQSTFGPQNLIYHHIVNGRTVYFRPRGASVPRTCPPGGFPFAADFSFEDGSQQTVASTAPCPPDATGARYAGKDRRAGKDRHAKR
jgi:hypothetical protein